MTIETTSNTRTLKAYAIELLRFPRLVIEREVDFTNCRHDAHYNAFLSECVDCQFGPSCRWLDQHRTSITRDAPFDELVLAIESACNYLQSAVQIRGANNAEVLAWIREARRFLRSKHD